MGRSTIALVVPSLLEGGGVPAVARFIKESVQRDGQFDLKIVSLATSARDESSVRITNPVTWVRGTAIQSGEWDGFPYVHIGAVMTELEFQRYQPRRALANVLSDCDLIQVVAGSPAWALTAVGFGKPVALQVATRAIIERQRRERIERGPMAWWRWAMTRVTNLSDDRGLQEADAVLVENPWMFRYALETSAGFGTWVRYAPPGVDTSLFHPSHRASLQDDSAYILSVGRFDDLRKNVMLLLDAYRLVRKTSSRPVQLKLAGLGDPGVEFWAKVRELGLQDVVSFHFRPTRQDLISYYQGAACFALPSDEEGFGIVVAEAMASGIPVVATRCGGPEGIITDGVDGFLVPSGDEIAMAARLKELLEDETRNRAIGNAARRTAQTRFSQEVAGEVFLDTYRNLLAEKKARRN